MKLPRLRKRLDLDLHNQMHRYVKELDDLQQQREVAYKQGDSKEAEFYTTLIKGAQDILERLQQRAEE